MTRALLVNPDWTGVGRQAQRQFRRVWPPLSLAVAASLLRRDGVSVKILDANALSVPPEGVGRAARDADLVFVTSTPYDRWQCPSLDISFFLEACRAVPGEKLFVTGVHGTQRPGAVLSATGARALVLGEPEEAIREIAQKKGEGLETITGLALPGEKGFARTGGRAPADLEKLPPPAFDLLPMERYSYYPLMGKPFAILEASRGCPVGCRFCCLSMFGKIVRRKSLEKVLSEVDLAVSGFGVRNLYFMDLEFGLSRRFVEDFCEAVIRRGPDFEWCCQTRVTDLDEELCRLMRRAGCRAVHLGVEAGSERVLAYTGKGISPADAEKAVGSARNAGLFTALFFNFGFPDETPEEMEATLRLAKSLNPTLASFHLIVPFPGTPMAKDLGVDPEAFPPHLYPQYNFISHDLEGLNRVLKRAWREFYLRPSWFLSTARDLARLRRTGF